MTTFMFMKQKTKKILLISFLGVMITGISAGFYLYNKGPLDVKASKGIPVVANELYAVYSSDSAKANNRFTSKILVVKGEISEVSVNSNQQKIILLKTGIPGAYVNCTLEGPIKNTDKPGIITIKGICSGIGQGDADLGIMGDVYLTRCFVSN